MKRNSNSNKGQSRREFTKSVAAAILATPFVPLLGSTEKPNLTEPSSAQPDPHLTYEPPGLMFSHIPPIIITGGSFHMELGHRLARINDGQYARLNYSLFQPPPPPPPPPNTPPLPDQYFAINYVEVPKEGDHDFISQWTQYPLSIVQRGIFRIWFQKSTGVDANDNPIFEPFNPHQPPPPHILLMGAPFRLYVHNEYDGANQLLSSGRPTYKQFRKFSYTILAHNDTNGFRIRQWDLLQLNGNNSEVPTGDGESPQTDIDVPDFRFLVEFYQAYLESKNYGAKAPIEKRVCSERRVHKPARKAKSKNYRR